VTYAAVAEAAGTALTPVGAALATGP
jgi:hypothetical protein